MTSIPDTFPWESPQGFVCSCSQATYSGPCCSFFVCVSIHTAHIDIHIIEFILFYRCASRMLIKRAMERATLMMKTIILMNIKILTLQRSWKLLNVSRRIVHSVHVKTWPKESFWIFQEDRYN